MRLKRQRIFVLLTVCLALAGVAAGSAWGGVSTWQDVWAQIKPLLSSSGTINAADNPVHWTKLKGVPAGLADGIDNGVDKAGFGLKKNVFPSLELAVDTTKVQQRVGGCPDGQAIRQVAQDGSVTCQPGVVVYQGWDSANAGAEHIPNDWGSIGGAYEIPAGTWSIAANVDVNIAGDDLVHCRLDAWANGTAQPLDDATTRHLDVMPLASVYSSPTAFRAAVVCTDGGNDGYWHDVRIVATKVSEAHTVRLG